MLVGGLGVPNVASTRRGKRKKQLEVFDHNSSTSSNNKSYNKNINTNSKTNNRNNNHTSNTNHHNKNNNNRWLIK